LVKPITDVYAGLISIAWTPAQAAREHGDTVVPRVRQQ
jgi:hypothetical protein